MLREVPKADFEKLKAKLFEQRSQQTGLPDISGVETSEYDKEIVDRGFLCGIGGKDCLILEKAKRVMEDMFTIRCATGFRRRERNTGKTQHFGLVQVAYEPQLLAAKALSSGIEYIARGTKGGYFYDPSMLEDAATFATESVKPGARIATVAGALAEGKVVIQKLPDPVWNAGYDSIFRTAVSAVPYTTNATDALKGTLQQERSNVLIKNLQDKSITALNPIARPMLTFRRELATLIAQLVKSYMPMDQFNKILTGQKLEGITYTLEPDPQTGQTAPQPVMIEHTDRDGNSQEDEKNPGQPLMRPITPYDLLMRENVLDYLITVDIGSASSSAKENFWKVFADRALLNDLMKDEDVKEVVLPKLIENIPDFPAEDAKTMSKELQQRFQMRQTQGTMQGIMQGLQQLPPDALEQIRQELDQLEQGAQAGQAPPQGPIQ